MTSTLMLEVRWFLGNLGLLLVHAFVLLIGSGLVLAAFAPTAIALDAQGSMLVSVVSWALTSVALVLVWFAPPILAVVLLVYRLIVAVAGHPRAIALVVAVAVAGLTLLVPRANPVWLAVAEACALTYAAILLLPGRPLSTLPTPIRGAVTGLSLSFVLFVGSLVAISLAVGEARAGRPAAAGCILFAGTALPATLFFADLWRDDVPAVNYPIAAAFVAAGVIGLGLIAWSSATAFLAEYSSRDS